MQMKTLDYIKTVNVVN